MLFEDATQGTLSYIIRDRPDCWGEELILNIGLLLVATGLQLVTLVYPQIEAQM